MEDCQWSSLHRDALVKIAEALETPDRWGLRFADKARMPQSLRPPPLPPRHRLNLVCKPSNGALKSVPVLWALLELDPRHSATTYAHPRLREHLPSREALRAWVAGYGAHVRGVKLSELDGKAQAAGCASPSELAEAALAPLRPHLEALTLDLCSKEYTNAALRLLPRARKLASLSLNLHFAQPPRGFEAWEEWEVRGMPA